MGVMRSLLLRGSESRWLRANVASRPFAQRAVRRFVPGETVDTALRAAESLRDRGMLTVLANLGEATADQAAAEQATQHYCEAIDRITAAGLASELSVKPTHLGLDAGFEICQTQLTAIVERAQHAGSFVWIDMESSRYADGTLELYRSLSEQFRSVGICVQAYLYRTAEDIATLIDRGAAVRLVKGAYAEPPAVAYPRKSDVDEAYARLGKRLLGDEARKRGVRVGLGTHDLHLIARLQDFAEGAGIDKAAYEIQMLYGIRRQDQARLAAAGARVRVLISYGSEWFPWYMRRLAERPANLGFVARSLLPR
jgi:proline dehydrogenase